MFGLKIFVRVQTFRRVPPVLPRNFCHPDVYYDKWKCQSCIETRYNSVKNKNNEGSTHLPWPDFYMFKATAMRNWGDAKKPVLLSPFRYLLQKTALFLPGCCTLLTIWPILTWLLEEVTEGRYDDSFTKWNALKQEDVFFICFKSDSS